MIAQVKARLSADTKEPSIYRVIKENDLKNNPDYSTFIFRNKRQEETFKATGQKPSGIPSIYNHNAVEFVVKVLRDKI
jgi:ATP-dependent Clp protease adapter protein ClpS